MDLTWMHWVAFGILLMLAELVLGTFFIFWFGLAGVAVGILMLPFPGISFTAQIIAWTLFSIALIGLWFTHESEI